MIRVTIELLPEGREDRSKVIGLIEIANTAVSPENVGEYAVVLKRSPPFAGALNTAWRRGMVRAENAPVLNAAVPGQDDELIVAQFGGHHRTRRGVYDLLYRALVACGVDKRNDDIEAHGIGRFSDPLERGRR